MAFQIGTIAIGSDHRAREIVNDLAAHLEALGWSVHKHYGAGEDSVDYPCIANEVTDAVTSGESECGVLICGSGIGMCIASNRFKNVRSALINSQKSSILSRQHNNANVMCLGARLTPNKIAIQSVFTFLTTKFEGGRHSKRVKLLN